MRKVKMNDEVIVLTGKDKGKIGKVLRVVDEARVVVESINIAKKHTKGNPMAGVQGGIVEKEMPLHISNVALLNPLTNKADKVGFKFLEDGRKVRYFKSNDELVDV